MSGKSVKRARVDAPSSSKTAALLSGKETAAAASSSPGGNKRLQLLQQYQQQQKQHDEIVAKLRADLETATKCIEQLRREKDCELRLARDDEQNRSALALKELETRLRAEWKRDVDRTRDAVKARSDAENSRTIGRYERTVKRLSGDLDRCRNELRNEVINFIIIGHIKHPKEYRRKLLAEHNAAMNVPGDKNNCRVVETAPIY
jgi:hypothetical protein